MNQRPVMLVGFQNQGNLGLGYLAAVLRRHGYPVQVVDIEQDPEEILRVAIELKPVLIGFSLIFQFFIDQYAALLYLLRKNGIDAHFTMGGHFPSLSYEQTLELIPELDSVVRFEGETTLIELVDAIVTGTDWRAVHGIAYRDEDGIRLTKPRALLEDSKAWRPRVWENGHFLWGDKNGLWQNPALPFCRHGSQAPRNLRGRGHFPDGTYQGP